jgi:FKBP-type peptidyl-prolyl cis-trans isomerase FkpA
LINAAKIGLAQLITQPLFAVACALQLPFMKNICVLLLCCFALFCSCDKTDTAPTGCLPVTDTAPAAEIATLQSYISTKGITATEDGRGFFYTISRPGSDLKPGSCSNVKVTYTLRLSNGTEVEANNGSSFNLGGLIKGWREGLPLIGEGGSMVLYLPPSLGYGDQASGKVPANSILVFYIDLLDVL